MGRLLVLGGSIVVQASDVSKRRGPCFEELVAAPNREISLVATGRFLHFTALRSVPVGMTAWVAYVQNDGRRTAE
jgi:hypothetical protein